MTDRAADGTVLRIPLDGNGVSEAESPIVRILDQRPAADRRWLKPVGFVRRTGQFFVTQRIRDAAHSAAPAAGTAGENG